jgi:predicted acetyltransferase
MRVELVPVSSSEEPTLSRLMQLYAYDFSEFADMEIGEDALFRVGETVSRCWSDPRRHAFFCRVDGLLAGFVILDERSRLTGDPEVMDVAELFVLRKHRRKGVGYACAAIAFALFSRKWEVRQQARNHAASLFWRKTIQRYTGGLFAETQIDDERWKGPVQAFDGRAR